MAGIVSYAAYIPPTRLALASIGGREAKEGGPEKAVAWNDEDAVTMAVSAAVNCLRGFDREKVDGVMFACTSHPFEEKQGAALLARALDLPRAVRTADFSGSLRAGTSALRAAVDAVAAGTARRVLVVASDCRMGAPGSGLEMNFGDGAVAFLLGTSDAVATLDACHAVADEIVDVWRTAGDPFVHSWEDRFVIQEGYVPGIVEGVRGLLAEAGLRASEFAKVALYAPDKRSHGSAVRKLELASEQVQDPLFGRLGNTGCSFALLQLAHALEDAKPGDRLLVASYGDGAEALALTVTEHVEKLEERRGVGWHLGRRRGVESYDRYLKARSLQTTEYAASKDPGLSATIHFRERDADTSLVGQKCRSCGAVQFPDQRICETCFAKDEFDRYRLSDRVGRVLTYTFDFFFPTPDPPTVVTICDIDGARVHLQLVNVTPEAVKLDMPVEFEFRRIHQSGGRPNYYWKATPQ
ncbi:MAG: zinc ribbon domain-containing protein [Myxococcota bacterium]|jgi:3-hydroxy-3-methylglutaryl CoA synthase|nr:3-hydroxy-3-methylglutaryl CoA synthase [Deltaproteobacteria bacterium]MCP4240109.1 3-hydroxy-3-methylglutaryl CoA synthase [bacterium]MDP6076130.1 zinc ribbon domain-containing protein [Myxococcota bacterium]MDP6244591.1 zinc ribbon domain-containing protein [Myxococcota bacterium]MDP7073522.1 zinc ribbon domain-containing protein [Myxococcota bacterium]